MTEIKERTVGEYTIRYVEDFSDVTEILYKRVHVVYLQPQVVEALVGLWINASPEDPSKPSGSL